MSDNREQFNGLVGKILALLVNNCPVSTEINAATFDLPQGGYREGWYNQSPDEEMLESVLVWLVKENFIRGENSHYVATLQTLKLYGSVPNAIAG